MSFATEELDENGEYKLIQHDTVMIPSFTCNAQQMETFLETIFSFKVIYSSYFMLLSNCCFLEPNNGKFSRWIRKRQTLHLQATFPYYQANNRIWNQGEKWLMKAFIIHFMFSISKHCYNSVDDILVTVTLDD